MEMFQYYKAIFLSCILLLSLLLFPSGINASDITGHTSSSLSEEKSSQSMGAHDELGKHKVFIGGRPRTVFGRPLRGPYVRPGAPVTVGGKPGHGNPYVRRGALKPPVPEVGKGKSAGGTGHGNPYRRRCNPMYGCRPPHP